MRFFYSFMAACGAARLGQSGRDNQRTASIIPHQSIPLIIAAPSKEVRGSFRVSPEAADSSERDAGISAAEAALSNCSTVNLSAGSAQNIKGI
jgi:hypothetical protein